jgi:hypothetical protein
MGLDRIKNEVSITNSIKNQSDDGWVEKASADNALAVASKAAVSGKSHYIGAIFASYSGSKVGLLQIKDGATVIAEYYVNNAGVIPLDVPIKVTEGNAVSAELAASGTAAVLGKVNLVGFTS